MTQNTQKGDWWAVGEVNREFCQFGDFFWGWLGAAETWRQKSTKGTREAGGIWNVRQKDGEFSFAKASHVALPVMRDKMEDKQEKLIGSVGLGRMIQTGAWRSRVVCAGRVPPVFYFDLIDHFDLIDGFFLECGNER